MKDGLSITNPALSDLTSAWRRPIPTRTDDFPKDPIKEAFGIWVDQLAEWDWWVTISFADIEITRAIRQSQRRFHSDPKFVEDLSGASDIPIRKPKNSKLGLRTQDAFNANWDAPGWAYAKRAWWRFLDASRGNSPLDVRKWVRVFEMQKTRGVPHIHALVAGVDPDVRRMDLVDWGHRNYGYTRVFQYDPGKGANFYLGKYLTKQINDTDLAFGGF